MAKAKVKTKTAKKAKPIKKAKTAKTVKKTISKKAAVKKAKPVKKTALPKKRLTLPKAPVAKKPEAGVKTLLNLKVGKDDRKEMTERAKKYTDGNLSLWLRMAGTAYKPPASAKKSVKKEVSFI